MTLQQQLTIDADPKGDFMFNSRLSRVVTKLFTRVIKAEEGGMQPFSSISIDTEAVLCSLEDSLAACGKAESLGKSPDAVSACRHLSKNLVSAILKARGESASIRSKMDDLGIDYENSPLGKLVASCASELGLVSSDVPPAAGDVAPSKDVASLVSAVGSASTPSERDAAIAALRSYKQAHGEEELNNHLAEVSAAFRAYILEQLSQSSKSGAGESNATNSMSERIKNLRSKLNATEAAVQSAVDTEARLETANSPPRRSGMKIPSPPKLPKSSSSSIGSSSNGSLGSQGGPSVRAFRDRLAAAQEKRSSGNVAESNISAPPAQSAGSRAAALRARLQAVKNQNEQKI